MFVVITMTIGDRIKRARLNSNLTQKQLGDACGMADSAIRKYESGKVTPKFETIKKISVVLGVDPYYIQTGIDFRAAFENVKTVNKSTLIESMIKFLKSNGELYGDFSIEFLERIASENPFRSNKGTRVSCRIDSDVHSYIAKKADKNEHTLEDEIEKRLLQSIIEEIPKYQKEKKSEPDND